MELDQLKEAWQNQKAGKPFAGDELDLKKMISGPSRSPVARMKKNLLIELYVVLFTFIPVSLVYIFLKKGKLFEVAIAYFCFALLFIFYFYIKNKLLNEMQCAACHLKSNLELQVKTLEKYVRNYLVYGTLSLPVILGFIGYLLYIKIPHEAPKSIWLNSPAYPWWQSLLAWAVLLIFSTVVFYIINKKYVHWLYGKHINRLKKILSEMDEDQS